MSFTAGISPGDHRDHDVSWWIGDVLADPESYASARAKAQAALSVQTFAVCLSAVQYVGKPASVGQLQSAEGESEFSG